MTTLDKLYEELARAREKEAIANEENKIVKPGDSYQVAVKFSDLTYAMGYTNGVLEAIDIERENSDQETKIL